MANIVNDVVNNVNASQKSCLTFSFVHFWFASVAIKVDIDIDFNRVACHCSLSLCAALAFL